MVGPIIRRLFRLFLHQYSYELSTAGEKCYVIGGENTPGGQPALSWLKLKPPETYVYHDVVKTAPGAKIAPDMAADGHIRAQTVQPVHSRALFFLTRAGV